MGASLVVQWLRLHISAAGDVGFDPLSHLPHGLAKEKRQG